MITLPAVLTPVLPGRETELRHRLAQLQRGTGVLDAVGGVHFARWVLVGSLHGAFPSLPVRKRRLRMTYLLLTAAVDGTFEDFVERLRTTAGPFADDIWSLCVGYPQHHDRTGFHAYFAHNRLEVSNSYIAHENTVADVRDALALRAAHGRLARDVQAGRVQPLAGFLALGRS